MTLITIFAKDGFRPVQSNPSDAGHDVKAFIEGNKKLEGVKKDFLKYTKAYIIEPFVNSPLHSLFENGFKLKLDGVVLNEIPAGSHKVSGFGYIDQSKPTPPAELLNELEKLNATTSFVPLLPGSTLLIPLGFNIALPDTDGEENYVAKLYARSGLSIKHDILLKNQVGLIDSSYRDEVCAGLTNIGSDINLISHGSRIAQLTVEKVLSFSHCNMNYVNQSDWEVYNQERNRGGGFGSTGV